MRGFTSILGGGLEAGGQDALLLLARLAGNITDEL